MKNIFLILEHYIDLVLFVPYYRDVTDVQFLSYWSSILLSYRMVILYNDIESFNLHTNQHTHAFSALCAILPIFGT
jgi:hypothetical protein